MNEILFANEAAEYLRMSYVTLEQWRRLGKGPPWHKPEGKIIYYKTDLDNWIKGKENASNL